MNLRHSESAQGRIEPKTSRSRLLHAEGRCLVVYDFVKIEKTIKRLQVYFHRNNASVKAGGGNEAANVDFIIL